MDKLIDFSKKKREFKIKNVSKSKAEIILYDEIGGDMFGGVTSEMFANELSNLSDSVKIIELRINSPGGDVFEGYTIFNRLVQHKAEVHVYVDGMAASIASLIMLAGDKIYMGETSQVMIHKPMVGVWGNSKQLENMIDRLDAIENQMLSVYRKKTGMDYIELQDMVDKETWLLPEQALELGFVDEVINLRESVQFAAYSSINSMLETARWIKNAPEFKISDNVREKVDNLQKDIEGFLAR